MKFRAHQRIPRYLDAKLGSIVSIYIYIAKLSVDSGIRVLISVSIPRCVGIGFEESMGDHKALRILCSPYLFSSILND
jgi:hypothetical protein